MLRSIFYLIQQHAHTSTSCGRFFRFGYIHCGRCVPCLVRRAAFRRWGRSDPTPYKYTDLSKQDSEHAEFDDVRAAAMATLERGEIGISRWLARISHTGEAVSAGRGWEAVVSMTRVQEHVMRRGESGRAFGRRPSRSDVVSGSVGLCGVWCVSGGGIPQSCMSECELVLPGGRPTPWRA